MAKRRVSITLDEETYAELIELTLHRRDYSQSAKANAAAAAIHAAHSKLPKDVKKALRESNLQTGFFEKVNEIYEWMQARKAKEEDAQ